ncbi:MAG: sensor histidine kinase [Anaerolineales bacterium]
MISRPLTSSLPVRLLLILVVVIAPLVVIFLILSNQERTDSLARARMDTRALAQLVAQNQTQLVQQTEQLMHWLASTPEIRSGEPEECASRLTSVLAIVEGYSRLSVARPNGEVICFAPATVPSTMTINNAARLYFQRAIQTKRFTLGGYQTEAQSGKPNLTFGYPIVVEGGEVRYVIGANLDVEAIVRRLSELHLPQDVQVTVLDDRGVVVLRDPDTTHLLGQDVASHPLFQTLRANQSGSLEGKGLDDVDKIIGYEYVPVAGETGLYALVGIPSESVYGPIDRAWTFNYLGLGLTALLALLFGWLAADRALFRPPSQMARVAAQLESGNMAERTGVAGSVTEIEQLAGGFDRMAEALQRREEEQVDLLQAEREARAAEAEALMQLQNLNQRLEELVSTRTRQLQTSNAKLLVSQRELRRLSNQLMLDLEVERTRIAREVHDRLGQALTAIKMDVTRVLRQLNQGPASPVVEELKRAVRLVDDTIKEVRQISADLRPGVLDDLGLEAAIDWQLRDFEQRTGLACRLLNDEAEPLAITPEAATAAYRILQEALTNGAACAGHRSASAR